MDFKDLGGLLAKLAPTIAAGLGTPVAGAAVLALEQAFGINTDGSTADKQVALATAISGATPDQLLAIKVADQKFALDMQKAGFDNISDLEKIAAGDRDSARRRETEVKDSTPRVLAYAITVGFFAILSALMFGKVPDSSKDVLYLMLGTLGTAWGSCISYFFGSTQNSAEKTKLLAASTPVAVK